MFLPCALPYSVCLLSKFACAEQIQRRTAKALSLNYNIRSCLSPMTTGWCSFKRTANAESSNDNENHHSSQKVEPNLRSEPNQTNCQLKQKISTAPKFHKIILNMFLTQFKTTQQTKSQAKKHNRFFGGETRDAKTKIKHILQLSKNLKQLL